MRKQQEMMRSLVEHANTPALSLAWSRNGTQHAMAYGNTDISTSDHVSTHTLFQAASLSKNLSSQFK